ncbi:beta strand repeat-containing protein [Qipengyuania zhejiangensis]|uniref:beta strand repeat-containing protein n=1 Tax=Qipengyuania zhejiangensis TaxID=3077782 RepID=UPI002D7913D3|nr:hypothetical protein [Qipengyuania sp. Z2]
MNACPAASAATPAAHHTRRGRWLSQGSGVALALGLALGGGADAAAQTMPGGAGSVTTRMPAMEDMAVRGVQRTGTAPRASATAVPTGAVRAASPPPTIAPRESATQAVQGTPTLPGSATFGPRTADTDVINIDAGSAVINWTTLDTRTIDQTSDYVNFLPSGTTLTFNGPDFEFTVLNRIFPTANASGQYRGVALDGRVESFLADGSIGGNIWFYSPGGLLIGNNARFSVGGLMLTSSDVTGITAGRIDFEGASDDFSSVYIDAGAIIDLPQDNSYFAVVAPTIEQHGTVRVNGSTTYFLTDAGSILLDGIGGLVAQVLDTDFNPDTREGFAAEGNYLVHTGSTGGAASIQVQDVNGTVLNADPHVIEFFAPNSPLSLGLSGSIGYDAATAVSTGDNGAIVLEAAFGGTATFGDTSITSDLLVNAANANIVLAAGDAFSVGSDGRGAYDLTLSTLLGSIEVAAGGAFAIAGDLDLVQIAPSREDDKTISITVEGATATAAGGSFSVGGNLTVDNSAGADTVGGTYSEFDTDGIAQAGDISISIGSGAIFSVTGDLVFDASATAGLLESSAAGSIGGNVSIASEGSFSAGSLTILSNANAATGFIDIGGLGTSGTVALAMNGQSSFGSVLIDAGAAASGSQFSPGAPLDATAQQTTIDIASGSHSWGALTVNGAATGGSGAAGETGGTGQGGNFSLTVRSGASLTLTALDVDGSGTGGTSGSGASGGEGRGGALEVVVEQDAVLDVTDLTLVADGIGGAGIDADFGTSAGIGGLGSGGSAELRAGTTIQNLATLVLTATGTGAPGGAGYNGSGVYDGNAGGDGVGGSVRVVTSNAGTTLQGLSLLTLDVTGTGGDGAAGIYGFSGASDGFAGGDGTGGSLALEALAGSLIELPVGVYGLYADGVGGSGGAGGYSYASPGSAGGDGGTGNGGSLSLLAQGGTISGGDIDLTATGTGGAGGSGGYYGAYSGAGTFGPSGINGGGNGGTVSISALEGSPGVISLDNVTIDASGFAGGGDITVPTSGGSITITDASTDVAGLISMASLTAVSSGGTGIPGDFTMSGDSGSISVAGAVDIDVAGDIRFIFGNTGQLVAGGTTTLAAGGSIGISHEANAVPTLSIDTAGDFIAAAGGDFTIGTGAIVNSGGNAIVRAEGLIDVDDIRGVPVVALSAGGDVTVNNAAASGSPTSIILSDGLGFVTSGVFITAGSDGGATPIYDPSANAAINGTVTSSGQVFVTAGGNVTFAGGSNTRSDNGLFVQTGDDIVIASGAVLESGINPVDPPNTLDPFNELNNMRLLAGAITALSAAPLTPLSSVVTAGTLATNGHGLVITGNAIDGRGGTIDAGSIRADINDAPPLAAIQGDDAGVLAGPCLEGVVCLGTISATNRVEIGQQSNNDVIALIIEGGDVAADFVFITTREDIAFGTGGVPSSLGAATAFRAESLTGDISLSDTTITSDQIVISAAGSLLGNGSLISSNTIEIDVGQDLNAALIDSAGQLSNVLIDGELPGAVYSVPGSINVGSLVQAAPVAASFTAGGDISFGSIMTPGQAIVLVANNGSVFLGTTTQAGAGSIDITGQTVDFTDLAAAGDITILATTGALIGNTLTAGGAIDLAGASIAVGDLAAGTTIDASASAGDLSVGNFVAGNGSAAFSSAGAMTLGNGNTALLGSSISADAGTGFSAGALGTNRGDILIASGGGIILGSATTGINDPANAPVAGTIALLAGGDIAAATAAGSSLTAGEDIALSASGAANVGTLIAGDDIDIAAASVTLGDATTLGTGIDLFSVSFGSGVISFAAEVLAGSAFHVAATGPVNVTGNVISAGDYSVSGASIALGGGTHAAAGALDMLANAGDITGAAGLVVQSNSDGSGAEEMSLVSDTGTISLAGSTLLGGTAADLSAVSVQTASSLVLGDVTAASLASPGSTILAITGPATLGNLVIGNGFAGVTTGGSLTVGSVTTGAPGAAINLYASGGTSDVAAGDLLTSGGDILVSAGRDIALGSAATGTGAPASGTIALLAGRDITANGDLFSGEDTALRALGDVTLANVVAGDDVVVQADGAITLVSATATGTGIDLFSAAFDPANAGTPSSIGFAAEQAGLAGANILLDSGTDITASGTLDAAGDITISAAGTPAIANAISGGDTSVTGAAVVFGNAAVGGDLVLTATAGDIDAAETVNVGGGITLSATGDVGFGTLAAQGGNFLVQAGGSIAFVSASASGNIDFTAANAIVGTGGAAAGANAAFAAGQGGVTLAVLDAATASLLATGGAISVNAASVSSLLQANADDIFIRAPGTLTLQATSLGAIDVAAVGDLAVLGANGGGDVLLASDTGTLSIIAPTSAAGPVVTGTNIALTAGQDIAVGGAVAADDALAMTAGGLIALDAAATGIAIQTTSADMAIGASGSLGDAGQTLDIVIASNGAGPMTLGGTGNAAGFALSADEILRVFGNGNLTFDAAAPASGTGPALVVEDMVIATSGGQTPGQIGLGATLSLLSAGDAAVRGALSVLGADDATSLVIEAAGALRIDSRTGNILIADASEQATGSVFITATDLFAMTDEALADIDGMTLTQINQRLAQNDGVDRPDGVIQAGGLLIDTIASRVFIQNTAPGTDFDQRRGLVVGSLVLTDSAGTQQPIVINGVVGQALGVDAIAATQIDSTFAPGSTINGCLIANPAGCALGNPTRVIPEEVQSLVEKEILGDPANGAGSLSSSMVIDKVEQEEYLNDPLIDEPVTGAGNEDLWTVEPDCDDPQYSGPDCPVPEQ